MSLSLEFGRAVITCDRCQKIITLKQAVVFSYVDLKTVNFVCVDPCSGALEEKYPKSVIMPAAGYFQNLIGSPRLSPSARKQNSF